MITATVNDAPATHTISSMNTYTTDSRGKRIAWARKAAGMTGHQLARAVGVRNVTISYIENDHRELSLPLLLKIAEVTGVTVGFLLMETDYPYRQDAPPETEPSHISPEADAAAALIDDAPAEQRPRMLAVLRAMAAEVPPEPDPATPQRNEFAARLVASDRVAQGRNVVRA